jgi:hypothetical protein
LVNQHSTFLLIDAESALASANALEMPILLELFTVVALVEATAAETE